MKYILVPTDFSENANKALKYGVRLFAEEDCIFHLLHTYTPSIFDAESELYSDQSVNDIYRINGLKSMNEIIRSIKKEMPNKKHSFKNIVSMNLLQDEIKYIVQKKNIDLIIMGTQGATGAAKVLFGTHTINAIREAVCPILAVPANSHFTIPKNILLPSGFQPDITAEDLQILNDIAEKYNSKVHILHLINKGSGEPEQEKAIKLLTSQLKNTLPTFHLTKDQTVQEGIFKFLKENSTDLLVMLRHKHSFLRQLFSSPLENELGFKLTIPLLVIPVLNKKI